VSLRTKNLLLIALVVLLAVFPLVFKGGAEYGGADGQAEEMIMELQPHYQPWFASFWEPPSGEIESLLFALQAAAGSGFIFFYMGYMLGRQSKYVAQNNQTARKE